MCLICIQKNCQKMIHIVYCIIHFIVSENIFFKIISQSVYDFSCVGFFLGMFSPVFQLQKVSQAVADILGQNQTLQMPIKSLKPSMTAHDHCTGKVLVIINDNCFTQTQLRCMKVTRAIWCPINYKLKSQMGRMSIWAN